MNTDKDNINNKPHMTIPQTFTLFQVVLSGIFVFVTTVGSIYVTQKVNEVSSQKDIQQMQKDIIRLELLIKENDNKEFDNYKKLAEVFDTHKIEHQNNVLILQRRVDDVSTSVDSLYAKMMRKK